MKLLSVKYIPRKGELMLPIRETTLLKSSYKRREVGGCHAHAWVSLHMVGTPLFDLIYDMQLTHTPRLKEEYNWSFWAFMACSRVYFLTGS
jgi:hypothetical protein